MKGTVILMAAFCFVLTFAATASSIDGGYYQGRLLGRESSGANSVAFSPSGKILVSGHDNGSIVVWDTATGKKLAALGGYQTPMFPSGSPSQGAINSVAFSPDGKLLASGSRDSEINIWDTATWQKLRTLKGIDKAVNSVVFNPDGKILASAGNDAAISLFDVETWEKKRELRGHSDLINSVVFSKDGKFLASGSKDRTIILWDAATGMRMGLLDGRSRAVESIDFTPDGKMLASGGNYPNILLWDLAERTQPKLVPTMQRSRVLSLKYFPDSKMLIAGYQNGRIDLWEMGANPGKRQLEPREKPVNSVALSSDGKMFASGDSGGGIMLWTPDIPGLYGAGPVK